MVARFFAKYEFTKRNMHRCLDEAVPACYESGSDLLSMCSGNHFPERDRIYGDTYPVHLLGLVARGEEIGLPPISGDCASLFLFHERTVRFR